MSCSVSLRTLCRTDCSLFSFGDPKLFYIKTNSRAFHGILISIPQLGSLVKRGRKSGWATELTQTMGAHGCWFTTATDFTLRTSGRKLSNSILVRKKLEFSCFHPAFYALALK